ncbi:MAG: hypothetical protein SGJ10_01190, partial [Bacteroidota bacterium]|nr:hypothetical protein [Bacteroidota bacterium]
TANTLKSQIELMRETNGLSYRQASVAIAKSYAAQDYKKNPNSVAELMASTKTLRIHKLNNLSEAYIKEYTKLASNNKNEPKSATQN